MKVELELNIVDDGRKFLNFWDFKHGNDICCEIIDGILYKSEYDSNVNKLPSTKISLTEFIKLVEEQR